MRLRGHALVPLLLLVGLGGCLDDDPAQAIQPLERRLGDPLAEGPLGAVRSEWDLGDRVVQGDGGAYLVRVHGALHAPEGDGPFPVVLLMHGRHSTCEVGPLGERKLQPCPAAPPLATPVDSYAGYDYLAQHLAGHGFVVLSLDANNVNDQDNEMAIAAGDDYGATARARLLLDVLSALRDAHHGDGGGGLEPLAGRLDLSRVGLMGHSRGGEGVVRAWELARDEEALPGGVSIGAVFALAPSDFFAQDARGVPFATLLPYCDGDVYDLAGARLYDNARRGNTAPIHQFLVLGANHNFYNTVWTGDDWHEGDDRWCGPDHLKNGRLAPEEQQRNGVALMGAFFRAYLGGETDLLPRLTGEEPWWPLPGILTSYLPPDARPVFSDDGHDFMGDRAVADGAVRATACAGLDCPAKDTYNVATQTALEWDGRGSYSFNVAPATRTLTFRMGTDPATVTEAELGRISVDVWTGSPDRTLSRHGVPASMLGAFVPPGDESAKTMLTTLRVDLPEDAYRVSLEFDGGAGIVQVADWHYV